VISPNEREKKGRSVESSANQDWTQAKSHEKAVRTNISTISRLKKSMAFIVWADGIRFAMCNLQEFLGFSSLHGSES
jgi:hypothetical protein